MSDNEDKKKDAVPNGVDPKLDEALQDTSSRARNKTVMLTPEVTGQIRDMLGSGNPKIEGKAPNVSLGAGNSEALKGAPGNGASSAPSAVPAMSSRPVAGNGDDWSKPGAPVAPSPVASAPVGSSAPRPSEMAMPDGNSNGVGSRGKTTVMKRPPGGSDPMTSIMGSPSGTSGSSIPDTTPVVRPRKPTGPISPVSQSNSTPSQPLAQQPMSETTAASSGVKVGVNMDSVGRSAVKAPSSKIVGFLISFDKVEFGEVYEIRSGRFMLSSRSAGQDDYIIIQDESISALHAIIRATDDGKIQILDQLSEFGTGVIPVGKTAEDNVSGSMVSVKHGDTVRFGKRTFLVCTVPPVGKATKSTKSTSSGPKAKQ